jgi:hypothetical protein
MVSPRDIVLALLLVTASPRLAHAHPIHTTMSELSCSASGEVAIRVRTFADDFSLAVSRHAGHAAATDHAVSDADAERYVRAAFELRDAAGKPVAVTLQSQRRTGDVVWLELAAASMRGLRSAQVLNRMLFDVHDDQVNIVKVSCSTTAYTTLFSRGDRAKRLP